MKKIFLLLISMGLWTATSSALELQAATFSLGEGQSITALGDIHGDLNSLRSILRSMALIDSQDQWIGGNNHLVLNGDFIDRGPQSRSVMDFIMKIQESAQAKGGFVHPLLGNHELMATLSDFRYFSREDRSAYNDFCENQIPCLEKPVEAWKRAFRGHSKYALWIASRPALVKIGDYLFAHGGVDLWAARFSIEQINTLVSKWIQFFQGNGAEPSSNTRFVIGDYGPLWSRRLAPFIESTEENPLPSPLTMETVDLILAKQKIKHIVVAHSIVPHLGYLTCHPQYHEKVFMIDSAISSFYDGGYRSAVYLTSTSATSYKFDRQTGRKAVLEKRLLDQGSACQSLDPIVFEE